MPRSPPEKSLPLKSREDLADETVFRLMKALMPIIVHAGVTPAQLAELGRHLIVTHTAQLARLRNGRINQSQLAAATGLSRAEIRRTLGQISWKSPVGAASHSTTARVIEAWKSTPAFRDEAGKPRVLPFTGGRRSFTSLVRKHGRDVTPRAMAAELQRRGLATVSGSTVTLKTQRRSGRSIRPRDADGLLVTIEAFVRTLLDDSRDGASPEAKFIRIPVDDHIEMLAVRRRVDSLLVGTFTALEALRQYRLTGERGRRRLSQACIGIALAVSETKPHMRREKLGRGAGPRGH